MSVLKERGPCLLTYLHAITQGRTHQPTVRQQIFRDVMVLREAGLVSVFKITGLSSSTGRIRGQLLTVVKAKVKK